jgi:hypothetical protein
VQLTALSETLALPLDRARTAIFVRASRVGWLRALLLKKQRRVPLLLLGHAFLVLPLALVAPTFLLVVGPLLLGVPHLVSDARYLLLQPPLPRLTRRSFFAGALLLLAARVVEEYAGLGAARSELSLAGAIILGVIALAAREGRSAWRTSCALGVTLALLGCALLWPLESRVLLGHGHNLIALCLWAALFAGSARRAWLIVAALAALWGLLVLSPLAWLGFQHGSQSAFGLHAFAAADVLAPGIHDTRLALGLVASFAFLQSLHYSVWLHAIPQDATRGDGTLSFRMSLRALARDLSRPGLIAVVLGVLLVPGIGLFAPLATHSFYLTLSAFHGYLELAAAALFFVRGERPLAAACPAAVACR